MITSLKIRNFKKHGSKDVTLTAGLNGIFGPNYTGKTTILYAILFALGGASQVPGTNLQKKGTNTGMAVVMEFTAGGRHYRVDRKKSGAYLYRTDPNFLSGPETSLPTPVMLASGTSNVTEKIEEILGMSVKRFRQLKYAEQKKAHALLTLGAGELHKIIEELTGIDEVNTALDKLKDMLLVCAGAIETLTYNDPAETTAEAERIARSEESLLDQLKGLNALILAKQGSLKDLLLRKRELREKRLELAEWKLKSEDLRSQRQAVQLMLDSLHEKFDPMDFKAVEDSLKEEEEVINSLKEAVKSDRKVVAEHSGLEVQRKKLLSDIADVRKTVEKSIKSLAEFPSDLAEQLESLEKTRDDFLKQEVETRSELESFEKMLKDQRCPTCFRDYEHAYGKEVDLETVDALRVRNEKAQTEYSSYKRRAKDMRNYLSAKHAEDNSLHQYETALNKLTNELSDVQEKIAALGELPDVEKSQRELDELNSIFNLKVSHYKSQLLIAGNISEAQWKRDAVDKKLSELPPEPEYKEDDLTEVEQWITRITEDRDALTVSAQKANRELSTAQFNLAACKLLLNKISEDNEKYEQANKRFNTAKQLQKYLRDNRDRYTANVWDFFLGTASSFVNDCTNGAITRIVRTDSGAFEYYEGEECMGMKDASGAQEAIMGLSVQMALAQAAQCPLDILLVDEPTADMDAEHSMAVSALLSTKGAQIIAVSHREMDASLCNNVINLEIEA